MIFRYIIQAGESAECEMFISTVGDALALLFVQMAYEHPIRNFTHLVAGCMLLTRVGKPSFLESVSSYRMPKMITLRKSASKRQKDFCLFGVFYAFSERFQPHTLAHSDNRADN